MFAQILRSHWTWTRTALLGFAVITFAMPALLWRLAGSMISGEPSANVLIEAFAELGGMLAVLSIIGAFVFASLPWGVDNETRHVYPLSLPITWMRYVSMRYAAGALLLLVPTVALWLGSMVVVALIEVPAVLTAYPGTLALRFLIASLLAYSATFALQYLSGKRAATVALLILLGVMIPVAALLAFDQEQLLEAIGRALAEWPGPLAIFAEPWRLIDV